MIIKIGEGELAGDYPLDMSRLTNIEVATVSRISGAYPLEWEDRLTRGDVGMVVAIAQVAVCRRRGADTQGDVERELWGGEIGGIVIDTSDEEGDDADMDPQSANEPPPGLATLTALSGEHGRSGSAPSETPSAIGARSLESSESRPSRSAG